MLPADLSAPHGVALRPGSHGLFPNAKVPSDVMAVFDTRTKQLLRRFALPMATHNFTFSPDGASIFNFAGKEGVSRLDPGNGAVLAHTEIGSPARGVRMLTGRPSE